VTNEQPTLENRPILCIGHRGAAGHEPENTLRSVRRALEMGANGVEVDVHLVEGELVVIHDYSLNRTTNGRGLVRRRTLAEIRALDAGKGERVPRLREVIEAVDRRALVNIELKGPGTAAPVIGLLRGFTRRGWAAGDFLISSFRRPELRAACGAGFPLGVLFGRSARLFRRIARALDAWSVNVPLDRVNPGLVSRVHAEGRRILVYTVNERAEMERMRQLGVDGFFTDYPDRWTAAQAVPLPRRP
jgi:glycerophosphoryl diester phosphodiesterase